MSEAVDELPLPDAHAQAHSERLANVLRDRIAASPLGQIPFYEFMDGALYEPALGYYQAGKTRFGSGGDFVTAPGISSMFGECVARQIAQLCTALADFTILELGAGDGTLAASILTELRTLDCTPAQYLILEPSPSLQQAQAKTLEGAEVREHTDIRWLSELPHSPLAGVILANEVLDAMPVHRFVAGEHLREITVGFDEGFFESSQPASDSLTSAVRAIERDLGSNLPAGYVSELNPALGPWIAALEQVLEAGLILLSDYGYSRQEYYHPQRSKGSLICHYRHRVHADPYWYPGLQDITASVDFTAVAEAASAAGLKLAGYTPQAQFLIGNGLDDSIARRQSVSTEAFLKACQEAKLLTLPSEMGERFRFAALSKGVNASLRGFAVSDLRGRL